IVTYRFGEKTNEKSAFVRIGHVFVKAARNWHTTPSTISAEEEACGFLDKALLSPDGLNEDGTLSIIDDVEETKEFFYDQMLSGLKSIGLALYLSVIGIGSSLSSFLISIIEKTPGGNGVDGLMIRKYFLAYTRIEVRQFRDTLTQHMESVKKSIDEKAKHKREYDSRIIKRQMQSKEGKVDLSKALDADLVVTKSSGTESEKHDTSSRSRNDAHAEDADIKPANDKEPMAEVDSNNTPDLTNMCHRGGEIDQNAKKCQVSSPLLDPSFDNMKTKFLNQSLESKNIFLKKTVAQLQKAFSRMEAHCVNMELKYKNQALKDGQHGHNLNETSNKAKIKKEIEVLETINIELEHSVAKLLTENEKLHNENDHLKQTYKDLHDSIKKTRVWKKDHNDSLITQINSKTVKNADLKAQIQEKVFANVALKNESIQLKGNSVDTKFSKPSILEKSIIQPPRNQSVVRQLNAFKSKRPNFSKLRNSNKPVEPKIHTQKLGRQIVTGHRFSPNKSSAAHEKTNTPRSCLRWIPTGRIFNTISLRWVPTGKIFTSSTTKVDCEPSNGSNEDITNPHECDQIINVSVAMASKQFSSGPALHSMTPATSSSGLVPNIVSQQPCIPPNRDDWDHLFQPMFNEYFNPPSIDVTRVQEAAAPRVAVLADSLMSTSIDQGYSINKYSINTRTRKISKIFSRSSSNIRQTHTLFKHLGKLTKDHPMENIIGDPSRSVSMKKQL
nr:proton-dependent oligopeptide transporter family [Tanacetum cinerariifolium]